MRDESEKESMPMWVSGGYAKQGKRSKTADASSGVARCSRERMGLASTGASARSVSEAVRARGNVCSGLRVAATNSVQRIHPMHMSIKRRMQGVMLEVVLVAERRTRAPLRVLGVGRKRCG